MAHAITTPETFWARVNKCGPLHPVLKTRCWPWTGQIDKDGYGKVKVKGVWFRVHRYAFFLTYGHFPEPCGLHVCDNPPCCNPDHIKEGTMGDNMKDMINKGRGYWPTGPAHWRWGRS